MAGNGDGSKVTTVFAGLTPGKVGVRVKPAGRRPRLRILLVEDNADIRETLTELLVEDGYRVEGAVDGPQGLKRILSEVPSVALVDVGLPGFDGYELARRVRSQLGGAPVLIALTGYGQPGDRERALEAGFDDHVVKPVSVEDLYAAIERTRNRKREGRAMALRGVQPELAARP